MKSAEHRHDLGYPPAPEIPPAQTKQIIYHQTSPSHPHICFRLTLSVRHCHHHLCSHLGIVSEFSHTPSPACHHAPLVSQVLLSYCPFLHPVVTDISASEQVALTVAIAGHYFLFPLLIYWVPKVSLNLSSK